jgi:lysozyme family protein
LQSLVGVIPDGKIGDVTLRAIEAYPNKRALAVALCDRRLSFLKKLKTFKVFGKGWSRRVAGVRARVQKM